MYLECNCLVYLFVNGVIIQMLAFGNLFCYFTLDYKRRVSMKKEMVYISQKCYYVLLYSILYRAQ